MEITIHTELDSETDLFALAPIERETAIDTLCAENENLRWRSADVIRMFDVMIEYLAEETPPDINEILIKQMVEMGPNIIPILNEFIAITKGPQLVSFVKYKRGGGPAQQSSTAFIKFDKRVRAKMTTGLSIVVPPDVSVKIIGLNIVPVQTIKLAHLVYPEDIVQYGLPDIPRVIEVSHELFGNYYESIMRRIMLSSIESSRELYDTWIYARECKRAKYAPSAAAWFAVNIDRKIAEIAKSSPIKLPISPELKLTPLLKELSELKHCAFAGVFSDTLAVTLHTYGIYKAYFLATVAGEDSNEVKIELKQIRHLASLEAQQLDIINKRVLRALARAQLMRAIETKLGPTRFNELKTLRDPRANMTAQEKTHVNAEVDRYARLLETLARADCKHTPVLHRLVAAQNIQRMKTQYEMLREFFDDSTQDGFVKCAECHRDIMCAHYKTTVELEIANAPMHAIRAALEKFVDAQVRGRGYCKICGEIIIESFDVFGDSLEYMTEDINMDEEIKRMIRTEMSGAVRTVQFSVPVDARKIIMAGVNTIYSRIYDIHKYLAKARTVSPDEIALKEQLYAFIYSMAYIIRLMSAPLKGIKISFRTEKAVGRENPTAAHILHAVGLITGIKGTIMRQLPDITSDFIRNKLVSIYNELANVRTTSITFPANSEEILSILLIDPAYNAVYKAHAIEETRASGKLWGLPRLESIEKFLQKKPETLSREANIYDKVRDIKWGGGKIPVYKNIISAAEFARIREEEAGGAFMRFLARIRATPQTKHVYIAGELAPGYTEVFKIFARPSDYKKHLSARVMSAKSIINAVCAQKRILTHQQLGRVIDAAGRAHSWKIYTQNSRDYEAGEYIKSASSGSIPFGEVSGLKCAICKMSREDAEKLDDKTIMQTYLISRDLLNILQFFEHRCPVRDFHEMVAGKCKYCGFSDATSNPQSREAREYYDKYASKLPRAKIDLTEPVYVYREKKFDLAGWNPDYKVILKLCNRLGVNEHLFNAMGAYEASRIGAIESGAYIPREIESTYETRIYFVITHLRTIIIDYARFRGYDTYATPPPYLREIAEGAKHMNTLPELSAEMFDKIKYMQFTRKPREVFEYILQMIAETLLYILDLKHDGTTGARKELVAYMMNKMLAANSCLAQPDHFSWSLLKEEEERVIEFDPEAEVESDVGREAAKKEEIDNAFSTEAFDIDEDADDDVEDEINDLAGNAGEAEDALGL